MKGKWFTLAAVVGVLLLPSSSAGATSTALTQQIAPLNCVLQTIDNGTGIRYQVTPEACGVVIGPPAGSPGSLPVPALPAPPSFRPKPAVVAGVPRVIDISSLIKLAPNGTTKPPITVTATVGQVYRFAVNIPAEAQNKQRVDYEEHSLIISDINLSNPANKTVTVTIHSNVFVRTISQGQTVIEDLDNNGHPDIGISAANITAGGAELTMWQIIPKADIKTPAALIRASTLLAKEQPLYLVYAAVVAAMIIASMVTLVLIRRKYHRGRE